MRGPVVFKSTIWTLVQKAKKDPRALSELLQSYRPPILNFISVKGYGEEAEDLTQEVFIRVIQPGFLEQVEASKGKFRTLLLTVTKRVMIDHDRIQKAKKRGGTRRLASLDQMRDESSRIDPAAQEEDDPEFDRLWGQNLIRQALLKYKSYCELKGSDYYSMFYQHVFGKKSQEAVAADHGRKVQDVKNAVHAARAKLRQFAEGLIRDYALEGASEELSRMSQFLPSA